LDIVNKYGVDSLRTFLVSMSSPDSDLVWNVTGLESIHKFLIKIFSYFSNVKIGKSNEKVESKVNKTIKEVTEEIENLKYNIAVIKLRTLFDYLNEKEISKKDLESCIKLLSLFCPHLTEELWEKIGNKSFLILEKWPNADERKIDETFEREEQSIKRLIEDINHVAKLIKEKESKNVKKAFVYVLPNEKEIFNSETDLIKKRTGFDIEVYSVSNKNKYDPENKSKKVKPGKPGIYLE
jgi:leucyl-tRNA synthetase